MPLGSPSTHLHIYNVSLKKETRYAMKMCFQYVTLVQYIMETNTFLLYQSKKKKTIKEKLWSLPKELRGRNVTGLFETMTGKSNKWEGEGRCEDCGRLQRQKEVRLRKGKSENKLVISKVKKNEGENNKIQIKYIQPKFWAQDFVAQVYLT